MGLNFMRDVYQREAGAKHEFRDLVEAFPIFEAKERLHLDCDMGKQARKMLIILIPSWLSHTDWLGEI